MKEEKTIIHLTSEVMPFYKRGGLADVAGSLPNYLNKTHRNIVISFYYRGRMKHLEKAKKSSFFIQIQGIDYKCYQYTITRAGIDYYFLNLEDEHVFSETEERGMSVDEDGNSGYQTDIPILAYFYFAKAALTLIQNLELRSDVILLHDWHVCGLFAFPETLGRLEAKYDFFTMLLIHNFDFQGNILPDVFHLLDKESQKPVKDIFDKHNSVTLLSLGLEYAKVISTVSDNYGKELVNQSVPHTGLDYLSGKEESIHSFQNGTDNKFWNPFKSPFIQSNFSVKNLSGKQQNKEALVQHCNLPAGDGPLVLFMARLTEQKGTSLLMDFRKKPCEAMDQLANVLSTGIRLIVYGKPAGGKKGVMHQYLSLANQQFPEQFYYDWDYSDAMAHQMLAGADMVLCPSLFEPCGLVHLYGMAFGAIPIVRPVGGLKDTVLNYTSDNITGTGFYIDEYNQESLVITLRRAVQLYNEDKRQWLQLMRRAMTTDFSWKRMIQPYLNFFDQVTPGVQYI